MSFSESNRQYIIITGIDSHSSSAINIYPVPNDGQFNVSITSVSSESFSISVYNSLGVKIYEETKVDVKWFPSEDDRPETCAKWPFTL